MPPSRPSPQVIALRGSATTIADYLRYAIYLILFLRGVYPIEDFMVIDKFDLELLIATNEDLETYVTTVLSQVEQWVAVKAINQVVLVIVSKETKETLERWVFDVQTIDSSNQTTPKAEADLYRDVHLMLAGIRGTNSMLSEIEEPTLCNILAYVKADAESGELLGGWEEAQTHAAIDQDMSSEVKLKPAATLLHRIQPTVVYRD
ncbi:Mitotic spindle checkpoint component mad2 [Tulasnella sp. JGI-2019a]|nr:Mitotic spindle checkpoint component mad2 [Tulasnella sp. JGI-2019a]KAG9005452.1 Mitotic spindle checkpoint component mad2 [Tulasnella sp. JGI-2019a]KAG9025343.1 Mitotic spindle checkpoint component mad2 [Tulasnella sp. JGI-2019a]